MNKMMKHRRAWNRLLSMILSLCMVASCMEGLTLRAAAEDPVIEEEPFIEAEADVEEETVAEEEPVGEVVEEWTSTNSLPTSSGSYKLMNDVTISDKQFYVRGVRVDFDLNGHTITMGPKTTYCCDVGGMISIFNGKIKGQSVYNGSYFSMLGAGQESILSASNLTISNALSNAIHVEKAEKVTIRNCTITDGNNRSAIWTEGRTRKDERGINHTTEIIIENTTIKKNSSYRGGAIYASESKVRLNGCTITENKGEFQGGAIYVVYNSQLDIQNTVITGNKTESDAVDSGAGIYISDDVKDKGITIGGTTEVYNNSTKDGKASNIYLAGNDETGASAKIHVTKELKNTKPIGISTPESVADEIRCTKTVVASDYYDLSTDKFESDISGFIMSHNTAVAHPEKCLSLTKPFALTITDGTIVTSEGARTAQIGAGEYVTIKADDAPEGKIFDKWVGLAGLPESDLQKAMLTFRMPAENVTFTATYKLEAGHLYSINIINGTTDKTQAIFGETVTVTAVDDTTYTEFKQWECISGGVVFADATARTTTFQMPDRDVHIGAAYEGLYDVKVVDGTADKIVAKKGETVSINAAEAPRGFVFDKWTCDTSIPGYLSVNFDDETSPATSFVMPEGWVKIIATYKDDGYEYFDVIVEDGIADVKTAREGETVTIKAMPAPEGMTFDRWDYRQDMEYAVPALADRTSPETTFVMPADDVYLTAVFKEGAVIVAGSSALDPIPEDLESCTEMYLVKGQKFNMPSTSGNWTAGKADKKYVSVSKKGAVKAKKKTADPVTISNNTIGRVISVSVCEPAFEKKKIELDAGGNGQIVLGGVDSHLSVYFYSPKPDVATVDQDGNVYAVSKGTVKISAYVNGKAYNCTVKVKEKSVSTNRTLHMNVNSSKTLSLKGIKEGWQSADETIATTKNKKGVNTKKITTVSQGNVQLTASANDVYYTVDLTVEDINLKSGGKLQSKGKNKYALELNEGDAFVLEFVSVEQDLLFKSAKADIAFADEKGVIEARKANKKAVKITTKINGKTVTISVKVNPKATP
ncbi:MAG: Ig-like domain-containing protein [Lachnospiraceae bacterium]|nr:Ig-like domain-containing protein [Lachnospiraceae bacterium]